MNQPELMNKMWERGQRGFTLIEMMIGSFVLIVGVVSVASLIGFGITSNFISKNDTVAMSAAERELERLKGLGFSGLTDGGSTLGSNGKISFSGSAVTGYSTTISLADSDQIGKTVSYDVRWNITTSNGLKKITVGAQRSGGNLRFPAVNVFFIKAP
jgi:type II secretory pathway pseudopilin PulG